MSAEILRRAASLMRERADLPYVKGEWVASGRYIRKSSASPRFVQPAHAEATCELWDNEEALDVNEAIAEYIAGMHPGIALAVADWLSKAAAHAQSREDNGWPASESCDPRALRVARLYLGESA